MMICALLILAYGPLNWTFPWWVWVICALTTSGHPSVQRVRIEKDSKRWGL